MLRRSRVLLLAVLALTLLAAPATAMQENMQGMQEGMYVTIDQPTFSWTGKEGQQANFHWSATVDNPYERPATVRVTLVLLDASGNVVGTDSEDLTVARRSQAAVDSDGSLAYSAASQATQYRVAVEGVEAES
jgi:hypothetical protein